MRNKTISTRYAQTLLMIAQERKKISDYLDQLDIIDESITSIPIVQYAWCENQLAGEDKKQVIKEFFSEKVDSILVDFLCLLIDKNREEYFKEIISEYKELADLEKDFLEVKVGTAVELSDDGVQKLTNKLSTLTGKKIRLKTEIIPDIIGGVVLKIGDKVIDNSVLKRLSLMGKELEGKSSYDDTYLKNFLFSPKDVTSLLKSNIVAEVYSPIELTYEKIRDLENKLSEKMGQEVVVHLKIDPSLLGGLTVKIGDKVMDGSVRKRLGLLEKEISKAIENWGEK